MAYGNIVFVHKEDVIRCDAMHGIIVRQKELTFKVAVEGGRRVMSSQTGTFYPSLTVHVVVF